MTEISGALSTSHVPFRARRSMAMCAVQRQLILFGGVGAAGTESILDVSGDCWSFDVDGLTWTPVTASPSPSPRRCVGMVASATGIDLWGGSGVEWNGQALRHTFLNDWWQLDLASRTWTLLRDTDDFRLAPQVDVLSPYPPPRYTPVFQRVGTSLLLFGGYTEDRLGKRKLNDTWIFDGHQWRSLGASGVEGYGVGATWPGVRYGCMSAVDGCSVYMFGGYSDDGDHNDLWQFDMREQRWSQICAESDVDSAPSARYCGAFAAFGGRLFLFGGRSRRAAKLNFNDLWTFDLDSGAWECLYPNRAPHIYAADAGYPGYHAKSSAAVLDGDWFLWGGEGISGHVSDFWRFSFNHHRWTLLQAARPDDPTFW